MGEEAPPMGEEAPPPMGEEARMAAAEGVGEDAAAAVPLPVEEDVMRAAAQGVDEDAAAAEPLPLPGEESFPGSPAETLSQEEVERRIEETKSRIEQSTSEESG